jgi:multidrug efflux pump subunit AcrB
MIGFIALAGIIVRNSILLVDFIQHQEREDIALEEAVIRAGAIRTRPILLTAAALMVGAFVIILDPIFQGLAVSLLFGVGASTVLTLLVIPVLYYLWIGTGSAGAATVVAPLVQASAEVQAVRDEPHVGTVRRS